MNYLEKFKSYLQTSQKASQATVKNYLADIRKFQNWIEAKTSEVFNPALVSSEQIEEFKAEMRLLSVNSSDRYISSLRKFYAYLEENNLISNNPFKPQASSLKPQEDPYILKGFKNSLYEAKASEPTIKNYLADVKQFLIWTEEVVLDKQSYIASDSNLFSKLTTQVIEEYKVRLHTTAKLSPVSINRKLSSIRKYLSFLLTQGIIEAAPFVINAKEHDFMPVDAESEIPSNSRDELNQASTVIANEVKQSLIGQEIASSPLAPHNDTEIISTQDTSTANSFALNGTKPYSRFGPIRMFQRLGRTGNLIFDLLLILPLVKMIEHSQYLFVKLSGKGLFTAAEAKVAGASFASRTALKAINGLETVIASRAKQSQVQGVHHFITRDKRTLSDFGFRVSNLPKEMYAPISVKNLPFHKQIFHHIRFTRPNWYRKYHSYAITHYFHFAILMIIVTVLGVGTYNGIFNKAKQTKTLAAVPTAPPRILSFQGRLTDATDTPITATTNLRFAIYNDQTASAAALLWQEVKTTAPDTDGIFNVYLGQGTAIPSTLFSENASLYLGITVGTNDTELTPRQQIATVAFASNSETLQGLPPSTAAGAGETNVVLALDSSGNLTIGGSATPTFQASGGQFTLSGTVLHLTTTAGSNSDIQITPDGMGKVDIQKAIFNSTNYSQLPSAAGAVNVDDLFAINATSSGQSALTINQDGGGALISASTAGIARFTVDNVGNGTFNGDLEVSGGDITTSNTTGTIFNANINTLQIGGAASSLTLGAASGTLFLRNPTINLGGGSATTIQTTSNTTLTLGGNTTGDIILGPQNGAAGGTIRPSTNNLIDLGTASFAYRTLYVNNIIGASVGTSGYWQRAADAISPANITDDVLIGGIATSSALIRFGGTANAHSFFNTGGNVGIGTTAPDASLDVVGTIRLGNTSTNYAEIFKETEGNSQVMVFSNPGGSGGYGGSFVFRGGLNSSSATVDTFRIYAPSTTVPGSVFVGDVSDSAAQTANATTNLGILNKITSPGVYDAALVAHPNNTNFDEYRYSDGKQFGIFLGGPDGSNNLTNFDTASQYGAFIGFQAQPLSNGYGSSLIFSAKDDSAGEVELLRLLGKNGNAGFSSSDPDARVEINHPTGDNLRLTYNDSDGSATSYTDFSLSSDGDLTIDSAGGDITSENRLTVGTTTPGPGLLNVSGSSIGKALTILDQTGDQDIFTASASGSTRFVIQNNGNVGIGTTTPGQELDVNGDLLLGASSTLDTRAAGTLAIGGVTQTGLTIGRTGAATTINGDSSSAIDFGNFDVTAAGVLTAASNGTFDGNLQAGGTFEALRNFSSPQRFYVSSANDANVPVLYVGATGQITLNAQGTNAVRFNYDKGTGGVIFGNGAGGTAASINSSGQITAATDETINGVDISGGAISDVTTLSLSGQLTSTVTTGTSPFIVASTTKVTNLNADLFDDLDSTQFCLADGTGCSLSQFWQRIAGTLSPTSITNDVLTGSTATSSALVKLPGTNNTDAFFNLGTGNLGIGTATPTSKLFVQTPAAMGGAFTLTDGTNYAMSAGYHAAGVGYFGGFTGTQMALYANGSEKVRLGLNGNVGIGSTSPAGLLDVNGTTTGNALVRLVQNTNADIFTASAGATTRFVIRNNGNVGIGTSLPAQALDVNGSIATAGTVRIDSSGNLTNIGTISSTYLTTSANIVNIAGASTALQMNGTTTITSGRLFQGANGSASGPSLSFSADPNTGIFATGSDVLGFATNGTEQMRISQNGNVGIGTTNPTSFLDVRGTTNTNNALVKLVQSGTADIFTASAGASTKFVITNAGNIGIGTSTPAQLFDVQGGTGIVGQFSGRVIGGQAVNSNEFITLAQLHATNYWQMVQGALSPFSSSLDVLVGGNATASALVKLPGTNNTDAFFNLGTGNLGINSTSPGSKLDVNFGTVTSNTGSGIHFTGTLATTGVGNNAYGIFNDVTNNASANGVVNGLYSKVTDATTLSGENRGSFSEMIIPITATGAKTGYGSYGSAYNSSVSSGIDIFGVSGLGRSDGILTTGTQNTVGVNAAATTFGAATGGTQNVYGVKSSATTSSANGATTNVYGLYTRGGGSATSGTLTSYGAYIANAASMNTTGTTTNIGLYIEQPTGADTNNTAIFAGGLVGIGTTTPATSLHVYSQTGGNAATIIDQRGTNTPDIFTASASGTSRFVIRNDGNVGIGTTLPTALLDVQKTNTTSNINLTGGQVVLTDTANYTNSDPTKQAFLGSLTSSGNFTGAGYVHSLYGVNAAATYTGTVDSNGNGNEVNIAAVNATGSFGGTIADASDLVSVTGVRVTSNSDLGTFGMTSHYGGLFTVTGTADNNYGIYINGVLGATNNYALYSNSSADSYFAGNVGLGTTVPSSFKLQVAGDVGPNTTDTYDLGSASLQWRNIYGQNLYLDGSLIDPAGLVNYWQRALGAVSPANITDDLLLGGIATSSALVKLGGTANANSFFNTGGNVGIGTTSPLGLLNINGAATGKALAILNQTGNQDIFTASAAGTTKFLISQSGNVAIGAGTAVIDKNPDAALEITSLVGTTHLLLGNGPDGSDEVSFTVNGFGDLIIDASSTTPGNPANLLLADGDTLAIGGVGTTAGPAYNAFSDAGATSHSLSSDNDLFIEGDLEVDGNAFFDSAPTFAALTSCSSLQTDGSGVVSCNTGAQSYWQMNSGALSPFSSTLDVLVGGTATASALVKLPGTNNTNAFFNLGTGNLGINSTSPASKLDVNFGSISTDTLKGVNFQGTLAQGASATTYGVNTTITSAPTANLGLGAVIGNNTTVTDSTAFTGSRYANKNTLTLSGNANKTGYGVHSSVTTDTTTSAGILYGMYTSAGHTGTGGGQDTVGLYSTGSLTGAITSGVHLVKGGHFESSTSNNAGGTIINAALYARAQGTVTSGNLTNYGLYIESGTNSTTGTTSNIGLYVSPMSGADTNYAAIFEGGNVGIGTTTPGRTLDVTGTIAARNGIQILDNFALGWETTVGAGSGTFIGGNDASDFLQFNTASSIRMYINSSGNVGIGTTSPIAKLDVNGTASASGSLTFRAGNSTIQSTVKGSLTLGGNTTGDIFVNPNNGAAGGRFAPIADNVTDLGASSSARFRDLFLGPSSLHVQCTAGDGCGQNLDYAMGVNTSSNAFYIGANGRSGALNQLLTVTEGGNVGIGTNSPASSLQVNSTSSQNIRFTRTGSTADYGFEVGTGQSIGLYDYANSEYKWRANGSDVYMNESGTGNVGIGTTTVGDKLTVNGNVQASIFKDKENTAYYLDPAGTTSLIAAGNVGLGTTAPQGNLHIFSNDTPSITGTVPTGASIIQSAASTALTMGVESASPFYGWMQMRHGALSGLSYPLSLQPLGGNVGIGSTNPGAKLDVVGNVRAGSATPNAMLGTHATYGNTYGALWKDGADYSILMDGTNTFLNAPSSGGSILFRKDNSQIGSFGTSGQFNVGSGTQFQVNSSGVVTCIQNVCPTNSAIRLTPNLHLNSNDGNAVIINWDNGAVAAGTQQFRIGNGAGSDVFYVQAGGNMLNRGFVYPGRVDTTAIQGSWYLASHGSYGLYSNTGLRLEGSLNVAGGGTFASTVAADNGISVDGNTVIDNGAGWHRTYGDTGWFNGTYAGGMYMTNSSYVTVYNGKGLVSSGNVGVGTTNPHRQFAGVDALPGGTPFAFINGNTDTTNGGTGVLALGTGTAGTASNVRLLKFFAGVSNDDIFSPATAVGNVRLNGGNTVTYAASGADFAEWFDMGEKAEDGDIISLTNDQAVRSTENTNILGVISAHSSFIGNENQVAFPENQQVVGLLGQIITKVSTINGSIKRGDVVTASNLPGFGKKAITAGQIVGKALADFDPANGVGEVIPCPSNSPSGVTCGKVSIYVSASWYDPDVYLTSTGNINIQTQAGGTFVAFNAGQAVSRLGAFASAVIADLKAGSIDAQKIATESLAIGTQNVTIAGQSLKDYILAIVTEANLTGGTGGTVPELTVQNLRTNLISPLASESAVVISGRVFIAGKPGSTGPSLEVSGDASISGTLRVKKIIADDIEGLSAKIATLSATTIINTTNVYNTASNSGVIPAQAGIQIPASAGMTNNSASGSGQIDPSFQNGIPTLLSGSIQTDYADIASLSGQFASAVNLQAEFGQFNQGLMSLGPTSLADTSVTGMLSIDGNMILAENSINVLGATLEIQPLRQGNVAFMGGLVAINTDGDLTVGGSALFKKNVTVEGTLMAKFISPVPDSDLIIKLNGKEVDGGSQFIIQNASGSGVLAVDQKGNVTASGSGFFKNVASNIFNIVRGAQADTSVTETTASASAGTAVIKRYYTERTIYSPYVTEKSLIYVTATSDTMGQTPYIARQTAEDVETGTKGSFTISIPNTVSQDIKINWWIVN